MNSKIIIITQKEITLNTPGNNVQWAGEKKMRRCLWETTFTVVILYEIHIK